MSGHWTWVCSRTSKIVAHHAVHHFYAHKVGLTHALRAAAVVLPTAAAIPVCHAVWVNDLPPPLMTAPPPQTTPIPGYSPTELIPVGLPGGNYWRGGNTGGTSGFIPQAAPPLVTDAVQIPVPEPASWMLIGIALVMIAIGKLYPRKIR